MLRFFTPVRMIVIALLLVALGLAPAILDFLIDFLPRTLEGWPERMSLQNFYAHVAALWAAVSAKLYLVKIVGLALFVIGAGWALLARMDKLPWMKGPGTDDPIRMSDVLLQEANAIGRDQPNADDQRRISEFKEKRTQKAKQTQDDAPLNEVSPYLYRWLNGLNRSALCLSGGGIRSASFALGVLQALATHPRAANGRPVENAENSLLCRFTYLSTVSGGGYIGSWLTAWITRQGLGKVWAGLMRRPDDLADPGAEPHAISWLREHGNYLTPKLGLTSPDTLATVVIFVRNLVLNWFVLLPLLVAPLILMKLLALVIFFLGEQNSMALFGWLAFAGFALLFFALRFTVRHRPSRYRSKTGLWGKQSADQTKVIKRGLLPSVAAAFAFTMCMALAASTKTPEGYGGWVKELFRLEQGTFPLGDLLSIGALAGGILYALSWIASWPRVSQVGDLLRWTASGSIYGMLVAVVVYFFANDYIGDWIFFSLGEWYKHFISYLGYSSEATIGINTYKHTLVLIHFGVPFLLLAQLTAEMIFVGLSSYEDYSDDDREWLGRAAALALLTGVGWLIVMYLIFVGGDIAFKMMTNRVEAMTLAAVLCITALLAAVLGRSHRTVAQAEPPQGVKPRSVRAVLTLVAIVCAGLLVVIASALIDLTVLSHAITDRKPGTLGPDALRLVLVLIAVTIIGANASKFINVNRFSMHALYRNRLVRTFLGATQDPREANPFTNFDEQDNPKMWKLWVNEKNSGALMTPGTQNWRPFHIVNIALNVTASEKHLAWQERKAAPFVVTPLHSGSAIAGFRDSKVYGNEISLGTAMAVSGAAASPNQGYNSSAPIAFLMSLLNVRLGWWLGNPGPAGTVSYKHDGPKTAARSLLAELLGMTREDQEYVYLSDGGHFENLGVYEMVRRRCRLIVVSDAGCDPAFAFEDLGNAVRKIEIDLGVPIRFRALPDLKPRNPKGDLGAGHPYHAIGEIDYPAADGGGEKGLILYIKPGYHGSEITAGIRSYAIANHDFPHDSTANQWFGESQMESYRALGFEITDNLLSAAIAQMKDKTAPSLEDIVKALQSIALGQPVRIESVTAQDANV